MSLPKNDAKEIEEIIGSIKQNFQCPICLELMLNPVSTKCDHKFCRHCILEVIGRKSSAPCPLCKTPVTKRSLQDLIEWKNFVEKVKQLVDAFQLDLAEEHVDEECKESADITDVPIPSLGKPSVFSVQEGTASTDNGVRQRRSVRFKLDGDELSVRQDKDTEVEQISVDAVGNSSSVRCMEGFEIASPTSKTSFVTSDAHRRPVSKKTNCRGNEFSETGIERNAAANCSATGVEPASSGEEDDESHGLITGGYQGEGDVDVEEMRPAAENHKIFRSRALSKAAKPAEEKSTGVHSMDDPYTFVGSQPTPKRKKSVQRKDGGGDGVHMFEDFNVLPKRRKQRISVGGRSRLHLPTVKKTVAEVSEPTGDEYRHEIEAMSDKLSAAESYSLVLSQQFKDSSVENKKSQKHIERSSAAKNLVSACNKVLPFASTENREQMQKSCSTFSQKGNEAIQMAPLKTGETVQKRMVPNKMAPNNTPLNRIVTKKVASKMAAPHSSVLKANGVEPNESVPSKICNKLIPIEAFSKEDVMPNKQMLSQTVSNEVLSEKMVPNEAAADKIAPKPNTDESIASCLGIIETSPNVGVSFHVASSSNSLASTVCEMDNYIRTEGNNNCILKQDGDISIVHPGKSSKRRKCSELVEDANSDNLSVTSRDLPQTRSSSRRRNQFQTVETKWQKKHQRNVAAKEERRKAIEEFDRLQDEPTSNCCTDSTFNSGLNQDKTSMNSESVSLIENGRVQCLEKEKVIGELEEQPTEKKSAGRFASQQTEEEDKIDRLKEQSMTTAVESSSQSSVLCVPDSVEEILCMEKISETVEIQRVQDALQTSAEKVTESSEDKSVKDSFKSSELFSENRRSDVISTEKIDTPLPFARKVVALENHGAADNVLMRERPCKNAVDMPDGLLSKPNGKGKTSSLEASDIHAGEKMLGVIESTLSDSLRTTDSISTEESQFRDSMAAPVEPLLKPKFKRKRKTFSLEASLRAEEKMNNSSFLQTDSIDIEQVIGEAVRGMLGKTGTGADDDLSTQDVEVAEAVWQSGQSAKGNSRGCTVSAVASPVGSRQCMSPAVEMEVILVGETEGVSTEVREEKLESEPIKGVAREEVVSNVEVVVASDDNKELLVNHSSSEFFDEIKEDTTALIASSCAKAKIQADRKLETQADRKSDCIIVRTDDSSSPVHSNSYSLLQDENKNCAELLLKDSSVTIHGPTSSLKKSMCLVSYHSDESLPDIDSQHSVEPTDLKSDELKVESERKSQSDLDSAVNKIERGVTSEAATCPVNYLNVKMKASIGNQSEVQSELNLVMESLPRIDPHLRSDLISENEQILGAESSDIGKSLENRAHQLSSTCEPFLQTEEIHVKSAEGVLENTKEIEELVTFVNVAEKDEIDESDESDDEITSPVSRANLTSSGNLSSESEMLTTQQRQELEVEVKTMEEEIARLQAELVNDVKTLTDKLDVLEAKEPDPELPSSPGKSIVKPNDCDNFEEGVNVDNPENDGITIIQYSPKNIIDDQTTECKVDELKTELRQCHPAIKDFEESSSDADLFGSQMSDIVAIPQTPTPTKDKTPRTRFSHRGMERDVERKETPRSPTPPPSVVHKKEKKSLNDFECTSEAKRLRLSHDQDHRTLSDENHQKINRNFNQSNDESKIFLKSLDRQGNYSAKVKENLHIVDKGIAAFQNTPDSKESSSSVATMGKKSKGSVCASSTVLRDYSSQLTKEKRLGSPFPQKKNWILVASGINRVSEMPLVEDFVRKLGCRFLQKFTNGTTHVLVKPVKEGSRRCQRTLKYFQGIANRSWVVSIEWIVDSIRMGCLQSEDKYEITGDVAVNEDHFGPTNARLSGVQLLRKFEICCLGAFDDLTRDDLRGLAETCGASSLQDPAMFSFDVDRAQVIIVEGSSSDTGLQQFKKLYKKFSVPIVAKEWLLDSVGTYDVKSLDEYAIYPPPSS